MPEALRELYPKVTQAIMRAENAEARGDAVAKQAYAEVSRIEEEISTLLAATSAQGALARRGAVRAALFAGDAERAKQLAARFAAEPGGVDTLRQELWEILENAELPAARPASDGAMPANISALVETAACIFPIVVGADDRLRAAEPELAARADPAVVTTEYLDMRRAFGDFAVAVAARAGQGLAGERLVTQALALLQATPDGVDRCVALTLDRALYSTCRALEIDARVNGASAEDRATLEAYYARLPALFPRLAEFRAQREFDRVEASSAGAALRTPLLQMLSRVARTDAVIGQNLSVDLDTDILAFARAPQEPPSEEPPEQIRVRTQEHSILVQTAKSAVFKLASIAARNSPLRPGLLQELAALPGL